uniref:Catalytic subunit of meta-cleavage enzyme n=1 Tax=Neptuniibacter sp. CAR-SF TaxID=197651 RepID=B2DD13_9GAMM|nr:catalytic subunit of meta-cleavage enzyme [Neptuniibacter sp. CAR-SF]
MAKIVSACATSHVVMSPIGCEKQASRVVQGMEELGEKIRESEPTVLIVLSSDHMCNIDLSLQPRFVVGVADSYMSLGDMDIPKMRVRGNREIGKSIVNQADKDGFDMCQSEEYLLDHGIMVPLTFMGLTDYPIVPVIININTEPMASTERCLSLAKTIRKSILEQVSEDSRVSIIGAGGLSHWLCVEKHGDVSEEFDLMIIDLLSKANGAERIASMGNDEIIKQGGNAGIEVVTWMMASAISESKSGKKYFYEPMYKWFTGIGGMELNVK